MPFRENEPTMQQARGREGDGAKKPLLRPCLQVLNSIEWGRVEVLPIRPEPLILGRAESCDITVSSPDVSRQHLRLLVTGEGPPTLQDLGSSNGTFVNHQRVQESILKHNDILQVGRHLALRFCYQEDQNLHQFKYLYDFLSRDALTGLPNRKELMLLLDREISFARRHHTAVSCALVDLDHFRQINEVYGHHTGDAVLLELTLRIRTVTRREEVLCRYGGEELVVLPREADEPSIQDLAERIRAAVCAAPIDLGELQIPLTVSIGIGPCPPQELPTMTPERLLELAEAQLHIAKNSGRNRVAAPTW